MVRAALSLLLLAYLPGALIYRLPVGRRSYRMGVPADERVFWALIISVAVTSIVAFSLGAAGVYRFDRLLWIVGVVCVATAALGRRHLRGGPDARAFEWTVVLPLILTVAGLWLFFLVPPAEWTMGGRDPGIYMNEGVQISQRGGLVNADPVVASLPPEYRTLFFPPRPPTEFGYESRRFLGFFILDPALGTVVGQFPHLYPVWIAIAYDLFGLTGARYVVGLWAVTGVLAVYFAGVWLFGRAPAFAAAALLTMHVSQLWFARNPNAEMLLEVLVFAGLLAYVRAHVDDDDRFFAPLAAVLLGLGLFAHLAGAFVIAATGATAILGRFGGQRFRWSFVLPLAAIGGLYLLYLSTVLQPYAAQPLGFIRSLQPIHGLLLALGGGGVALLAWLAGRPAVAARVRLWLPVTAGLVVVVAAVYALAFREAGGRLALHDAAALRTFTTFYLLPLGLAAALGGWLLFVATRFWRGLVFGVTAGTLALFFFYKARIVPEHFWWSRRFLPVILPSCLLLVGYATLGDLRRWSPAGWLGRTDVGVVRYAAGVLVVIILGLQYMQATRPILRHVEYAGLVPQLEAIAGQVGDGDLVLIESRASSDTHALGVPLQFIYARPTLAFDRNTPDKPTFRAFLEWAETAYDRVLFIGSGGMDLMTRNMSGTTIAGARIDIPEYDRPLNAYPTEVRRKVFDVGLYELHTTSVDRIGFDLDVGGDDGLYVQRFHDRERGSGDVSFRWTEDESRVSIVGGPGERPEVVLTLAGGGRPATVEPAIVTIWINDVRLGSVTVTDGFQPYVFAVPDDVLAALGDGEPDRLRIGSTTWSPAETLGVMDPRVLGVMVDRIEIRSAAGADAS